MAYRLPPITVHQLSRRGAAFLISYQNNLHQHNIVLQFREHIKNPLLLFSQLSLSLGEGKIIYFYNHSNVKMADILVIEELNNNSIAKLDSCYSVILKSNIRGSTTLEE